MREYVKCMEREIVEIKAERDALKDELNKAQCVREVLEMSLRDVAGERDALKAERDAMLEAVVVRHEALNAVLRIVRQAAGFKLSGEEVGE